MWLESLAFGWQCFMLIRHSGFYILVTFLHFVKLFNAIILLYGLLNHNRALVAIFLMTISGCILILFVHCVGLLVSPAMKGLDLGNVRYIAIPAYFACYFYFIWVIYSYFILSREPRTERVEAA
ncbi:Hypothetical predicted protein [Drosophila guanche]|uniref:Uncharacterized protein n=2 Tax=Drosophila guanche TaxID=7266 RepID=A0A3B0JQK3_DROGU|nr:Hypothetical predicted protein [Drosophila guanche]